MKSIVRILAALFNRMVWFYLVMSLLGGLLINQKQIKLRLVNYLREPARYVIDAVEGRQPPDKLKCYQAIEYYKRLNKLTSEFTLNDGAIGYCYYQLGNKEKAVEFYQEAVKRHPDFVGFHYNLGKVYYEMKKWDLAAEAFKKALSVDPDKTITYFHIVLARKFSKQDQAERWFRKESEKLRDVYYQSLVYLVKSYHQQKNFNEAFLVLQMGMSSYKFDHDYYLYYLAGKSAYEAGQLKAAQYYLDRSIKLNQRFKPSLELMGLIFKAVDNSSLAAVYETLAKQAKETDVFLDKQLFYYIPIQEILKER